MYVRPMSLYSIDAFNKDIARIQPFEACQVAAALLWAPNEKKYQI